MALQLSRGLSPTWYTPKQFEGEDPAPQLLLQPLTQQQLADVLNDSVSSPDNGIVPSPQARAYLFRVGIKDWRNITDADGNPVEFKREQIQHLPWEVQIEVASRLIIDAMLGADLSKKSQSQSQSLSSPTDLIATTASGADTATTATPPPSPSGQ